MNHYWFNPQTTTRLTSNNYWFSYEQLLVCMRTRSGLFLLLPEA